MTNKTVFKLVNALNGVYYDKEKYFSFLEEERNQKTEEFYKEERQVRAAYNQIEDNLRYLEGFKMRMRDKISDKTETQGEKELDLERLSKLNMAVKLSMNDPNAITLYREACMQMNKLMREKEILNRALERIRKNKEEYFEISKQEEKSATLWTDSQQEIIASSDFSDYCKEYQREVSGYVGYSAEHYSIHQIGIGTSYVRTMVFPEIKRELLSVAKEVYSGVNGSLKYNAVWDMDAEPVLYVEYTNDSESEFFGGLQNILMHIAHHCSDAFARILFVDPIRFSARMLGELSVLAEGNRSWIEQVPNSDVDIKKKINGMLEEIQRDAQKKDRLMILHGFPNLYDSESIRIVQQLFTNADSYHIKVILTNNVSECRRFDNQVVQLITKYAKIVGYNDRGAYITEKANNKTNLFTWYKAPEELSETVKRKLIYEKPKVELSSVYNKKVDISCVPSYLKGCRGLCDIPYGIDTNGNVLTLDFMRENFGTFVSGASRSGKSTLLHSIITGILKNNHPDDVELWLVDFKMTEFSRYITKLPPHVRYIVLDESPEVIYDIIDRLTEILEKRQNIFQKEGWEKLSEVPQTRYMPAIMVIIDEFSVMSQVLADSVLSAKENYMLKLQTILAKGAALGLHFIFASQGFTSGSRGLNDFSKKQIQQRISLKTEYAEIRATLDLTSESEEDKRRMGRILPYHTLLRRSEADIYGNWLIYGETLYFEDKQVQLDFINMIKRSMHSVARFDPYDVTTYISKKPLVIDGNSYQTYDEKEEELNALINKNKEENYDFTYLVLGEPKRMLPVLNIALTDSYNENIILVAPTTEIDPATAIMISMAKSAKYQDVKTEFWSESRNPFMKLYRKVYDSDNIFTDESDILERIHEVRRRIERRKKGNCLYFLLGFDILLKNFAIDGQNVGVSETGVLIDKREKDKDDLITQMKKGVQPVQKAANNFDSLFREKQSKQASDPKEELIYILQHGSKYGYHFVMMFGSMGEYNLCKIDSQYFTHKIFFRAPKNGLTFYLDSLNANVVANMPPHVFRYTNGLESDSYKPYFHKGLSWSGMEVDDDGKVSPVKEEEEYLM